MSRTNIDIPDFHPSFYETVEKDLPKDTRTLMSQTTSKESLGELSSATNYQLTVDDKQLSVSNTKYLFRGLYGETLLTFLFFSDKNVRNIQNLIRFVIYKQTEYTVDDQSINELLIIMRSIFLEYSAHPKLIEENMSPQEKIILMQKYTKEVERLNDIVVNAVVPKVVSQMIQYINYLKDASRPAEQLERPKSDNVSGQREYRSITEVLIGSNL